MLSESSKEVLRCFFVDAEGCERNRELAQRLGPARTIAVLSRTGPRNSAAFIAHLEANRAEAERFVAGILGMT